MKDKLNYLPENPGVYIFKDLNGTVIYVGKAVNLKNRISSYFSTSAEKSWKTASIKLSVEKIEYVVCLSEREALIVERQLIKKYNPFFNKIWKDNKEYYMLKITKEDYPKLIFTRKKENDGGVYFGPFPKSEIVKNAIYRFQEIGLIRLRRCKWDFSLLKPLPQAKIRSCLYYHTRQCPAPCDFTRMSQKDYLELVKRAEKVLRGDYLKIAKTLKKEMFLFSKTRQYEKAAQTRDCLKAIEHMSQKVRIEQTSEKEALEEADVFLSIKEKLNLKKIPIHIEVFDVSQLFSRQAVASCVCFLKGEKNFKHYRKFKIRYCTSNSGGDDLKMIAEAVERRLKQIKNNLQDMPDLIVIDGGATQLKKAIECLRKKYLHIDIIALAKKFEQIYIPKSKNPITLDWKSKELLFLRKIRDEAHRFAVTYHRKIRNRNFL